MTTQEKIEAIRAACIAANPVIMELGLGCEFSRYSDKKIIDTLVSMKSRPDGIQDCSFIQNDDFGTLYTVLTPRSSFEEWIILGRPIRLADVLLAISVKIPWTNVHVEGNGNIIFRNIIDNNWIIQGKWNLLKDDLRDQSSETVEFIYSLLK